MDRFESIVRRAALWHQGKLPPQDAPPSYNLRVAGPRTRSTTKIRFHTYAGLFPGEGTQGQYVAIRTGEWPRLGITASEMRDIVASNEVDLQKAREQRRLVTEKGRVRPYRQEWTDTIAEAEKLRLPIGFYAVGYTGRGDRVVVMRVILYAPIGLFIERFKRATPHIHFD